MKQANNKESSSRPLERYLRVLEAVAAVHDGLSARELMVVLELPRSTVDRLLNVLLSSDLIHAEGTRNVRYRLGPRLLRIIQSDAEWLKMASRRVLKELADETGETSFIAKLEGSQVYSVAMESPDASVGVYVTPGHELPPHAAASGKLLTALQDDIKRDKILATDLVRYTDKTIVSLPRLLKEYAEIQRLGYAMDRGEHVEGLSTIACPILLPDRSLGSFAVALTGLSDHFTPESVRRFLPLLQSAASRIAATILLPQRRT